MWRTRSNDVCPSASGAENKAWYAPLAAPLSAYGLFYGISLWTIGPDRGPAVRLLESPHQNGGSTSGKDG